MLICTLLLTALLCCGLSALSASAFTAFVEGEQFAVTGDGWQKDKGHESWEVVTCQTKASRVTALWGAAGAGDSTTSIPLAVLVKSVDALRPKLDLLHLEPIDAIQFAGAAAAKPMPAYGYRQHFVADDGKVIGTYRAIGRRRSSGIHSVKDALLRWGHCLTRPI